MAIVEGKILNKAFGSETALDGLDISIVKGSFVSIMGPSGSGKSTLLNVLSGLEQIDSGEVSVNNTNITRLKEPKLTKFRRKNIGYIFQGYNLIDYLTAYENVVLQLKISGSKINKREIGSVMDEIGLADHYKKYPFQLSGGQKQRVAIARSIVSESEIVFADEPTGALDIFTREKILALFSQVNKKFGKTLIVVTHDPQVAAVSDEVFFLLNGKIVERVKKKSSKEIANILIRLENENVHSKKN